MWSHACSSWYDIMDTHGWVGLDLDHKGSHLAPHTLELKDYLDYIPVQLGSFLWKESVMHTFPKTQSTFDSQLCPKFPTLTS